MSNQYDDQRTQEESLQPIGNAAKKRGRKVAGKISQAAKKVAREAVKKAAKIALKAAKKAILILVKVLGWPLLIALAIAIVVIIVIDIAPGSAGLRKQYSETTDNELIETDDGTFVSTEELMDAESKVVRDFYIYHSGNSFHQIVGDDNTKLLKPDDSGVLEDYYRSSDIFRLNANLLYSMDKYLLEDEFKFPEQFTKPVYYDPESLALRQLVDSNGFVTAESDEIDPKTGKATGNKIKSVRDYGLGSIIKYNLSENWKKTVTMRGEYVKKDVWDPKQKKVVTVEISPESFSYELRSPEPINLVEKVITFMGEVTYVYGYEENKISGLLEGASPDENSTYQKILYDTYEHVECTFRTDEFGEYVLDERYYPIQDCSEPEVYELFKYRSEESGVFETLPVQKDVLTVDKGDKYIKDYINNFEAYVPSNVINNFSFSERIDYQSTAFNYESTLGEDYNLKIGGGLDTPQFKRSKSNLPIINKHAEEFGVDPLIILAMLTQESGGRTDINSNGIMQITSNNDVDKITAKNKNGELVTVSITKAERRNNDKSIRYATAYLKKLTDDFGGDVLKAIQGYNLGPGTMNYIYYYFPEAWNHPYAWLYHREEARQSKGGANSKSASYGCLTFIVDGQPVSKKGGDKTWGDSCYLENVLRYYSGNNMDALTKRGISFESYTSLPEHYKDFLPDENADKTYKDFSKRVDIDTVELILSVATSFDNQEHMGDVEVFQHQNFWDSGFLTSLGSKGFGLNDLEELTGYVGGYHPPIIIDERNNIRITSKFGPRFHPIYKEVRQHNGIDVAAPMGTPLYATADGIVKNAQLHSSYGNYVRIDHGDGTESLYAHLSKMVVNPGQSVVKGQLIGEVGSTGDSTGPHLHFEYIVNGARIDPISILMGNMALNALEEALTQIGKPYVWGGVGPYGYDCSGLVVWAYKKVGYKGMPRTTPHQYTFGELVSKENVQRGDLIYFNNTNRNKGAADHVAFYLGKVDGKDMMLHAPRPGAVVEIRTVYWDKMISIRRHK